MFVLTPDYQFEYSTHQGVQVIRIYFAYDHDLIKNIKLVKGCKWSKSMRCWYVPDNKYFRSLFQLPEKIVGKKLLLNIHPENHGAMKRYLDTLLLKAYSQNTIRTYTIEFAQLLYALKQVSAERLPYERVRDYFLYCTKELKLSENQLHSRINAIKFYYEQVLNRERFLTDLPRPKKPQSLAKVLNDNEVLRLFGALENDKHRLVLKMCYGMGLRVSELVGLQVADIDSKRMQVHIRSAKGKKDRYVALPKSALEDLRQYYRDYHPKVYLFEGQFGGPYSIRSVQQVFKSALSMAKIKKKVGVHSLRHSYATHMLENGVDISFLQKLLGHRDLKTTLGYTHIAQPKLTQILSPLDKLS